MQKGNCRTNFLTRHIKFCTYDDSTPKEILACMGAFECGHTPFIDRPAVNKNRWMCYMTLNENLISYSSCSWM